MVGRVPLAWHASCAALVEAMRGKSRLCSISLYREEANVMRLEKAVSRRSFLGLAGVLTMLAGIPAFLGLQTRSSDSPYAVVDRWPLSGGGQGLFIVTRPNINNAELKELGTQLRDEFRNEPNMVVQIFDDAAAAKDARAGSRIVGEPKFRAALAHQKASYLKNAATGQHSLTILSEPQQIVRYSARE